MGLREKKKERTRKLISDVARDLFLEKGFQAVTVAEIADRAEVAVTTLFNYFPTKESIVFDREDEIGTGMLAAIRGRKKDQTVLGALHRYFLDSQIFNPPNKRMFAEFTKLIRSTPELNAYYREIWSRYGKNLAKEILSETGIDKAEAECMARLILEGVSFAGLSPAPGDTLNLTFKVLKNGWNK